MRTLLLALVLGLLPAAARAQTLVALSHSCIYDTMQETVAFTIEFNRPPDFLTVDPQGRQADSFQFYLHTLPIPGLHGQGNTIVRGGEIHIAGDVRFRNDMLPGQGKPGSGGWGPIAGSVPYVLIESTITFTAPFSIVNTPSGLFTYDLLLAEYGAMTYWSPGNHSIPGPGAAVWLFAGAFWAGRRRRATGGGQEGLDWGESAGRDSEGEDLAMGPEFR